MHAVIRQFGPLLLGAALLAVVVAWSMVARPPLVVSGLALLGGAGLIAWGVVGPPARQRHRTHAAVRDVAYDLTTRLGARPPAATESENEPDFAAVIASLRAAGPEVDALLSVEDDRRWLLDVIEAVGEPVVSIAEDGRVQIVNRAAERVLGVRLENRPKTIEDLFAQNEVLALHESATRGRPASARIRLAVGDGARVFDTTASPIAPPRPAEAGLDAAPDARRSRGSPQRWGVVLAFRDVTELTTAIQARTDFVANASHELRTPLAALKAAYETLRLAIDDPKMRERAFQLSGSNLQRLEEMTRDLLDLSRMESPDAQVRISRVDVQELAEDMGTQFEPVCQSRRLTLSIEIEAAARRSDTDPRLVQEILRNLVDNACRFAHEGTTVRVVGEAVGEDPHAPERATLRLRVIDQGAGIPLDQQARIFERFYQVDPARSGKRRGTGLGLAIVKHAVRALGGSVRVESVWGQGTTMIVDLPSAVALEAQQARGGERERAPDRPAARN